MIRNVFLLLMRGLIAFGLGMALPIADPDHGFLSAAWADDDGGDDDGGDDDGEGGDDDDDGSSGSSSGAGRNDTEDGGDRGGSRRSRAVNTPERRSAATAPRRANISPPRAVAARPLPARAPNEIVVIDLSEADLGVLIARNYQVIETRQTAVLTTIAHRLRIPDGTALDAARDEVRALPTGGAADFNTYYRPEQAPVPNHSLESAPAPDCDGPQCATFDQVGWAPGATADGCASGARIGLIDTGINPDHATFAAGQLTLLSVTPDGMAPSGRQHGTAVASILIGRQDSRSPGLVPEAIVVAVDAFHTVGRDQRSDIFSLVAAMEQLAVQDVDVLNMSLSGPPNTVLERMVARLAERGIVVVAAAGNDGPRAAPVYPGAYDTVLTVTAVDRSGAVYRRAGQGPHVDLAAPGVEVWTAASIRGARGKTGTSFAAPFVTAAVAMLRGKQPELTVAQIAHALTTSARDLGPPGRDEVYGAGLIQFASLCDRPSEARLVRE